MVVASNASIRSDATTPDPFTALMSGLELIIMSNKVGARGLRYLSRA
jgi:hypothetical protein